MLNKINTKYIPMKGKQYILNQDVIRDIMMNGDKICRIAYKVIEGILVMISIDRVVKPEIDATVKIIRQLMKDTKKKHIFDDEFILTYSIPRLQDVVA